MRKLTKYILFLLLVGVAFSAGARKNSGGKQKVYIFGFASSFADTVAYMTDVQELDSAYLMGNGFLADRALYSLQFFAHVNEKRGVENPTSAVFFSPKAKTLQKKYQKVKQKYIKDPSLELVIVPRDEFAFEVEEYMETLVTEEEASESLGESAAATNEEKPKDAPVKKGKKDKKKKK